MVVEDQLRRRVQRNVAATIAQVIATGVTLFAVYRLVVIQLGIEMLGVWSLVMASAAIARVGEVGAGGAAARFIASDLAEAKLEAAVGIARASAIVVAVLSLALLVVLVPLLLIVLRLTVEPSHQLLARQLLPYALISIWVSLVSGTALSALDGCRRVDLRAAATVAGYGVFGVLAWVLVPTHGLYGLVFGQLGQALTCGALGVVLLGRELPGLFSCSWKPTANAIKRLFSYASILQLVTLLGICWEPAAKWAIGGLLGSQHVGYFEMANKFLLQIRGLIVEANRVMVPEVAALRERSERLRDILLASYKVIVPLTIVVYGLAAAALPVVSRLWIGALDPIFVAYGLLFTLAWAVNTLIGPCFFSNVATGRLIDNLRSQALNLVTLAVGFLLLAASDQRFLTVPWVALSICTGSAYLLVTCFRKYEVPVTGALLKSVRPAHGLFLVLALGVGWLSYAAEMPRDIWMLSIVWGVFAAIGLWSLTIVASLFRRQRG